MLCGSAALRDFLSSFGSRSIGGARVSTNCHVLLGEVASHISSGATPRGGAKTYLEVGPVMFIRSQHVHMNRLKLAEVSYISDEVDNQMTRSQVVYGDVLLNITGASIGRVAAFDLADTRANVNQHVCIIRPVPEKLDYRYLVHFLQRDDFQREIERMQQGGTRQALTFAQIKKFKIPLPPLSEQKRIAGILDKADSIRRKRQQAIGLTEQFLRSTFLDMFGDPVTNPKGWEPTTFGTICDANSGMVQTGPFGSQLHKHDYSVEGTPVVMPQDLIDGTISTASITRVADDHIERLSKHKLVPGDVLYSRRGDVTRFAIIAEREAGWLCGTGCIRVRHKSSRLSSGYLKHSLNQESVKDWLTLNAKGATMPNLNTKILRALPIRVPPADLQAAFESIVKRSELQLHRIRESCEKSDNLFNSLVQRAFRGEL